MTSRSCSSSGTKHHDTGGRSWSSELVIARADDQHRSPRALGYDPRHGSWAVGERSRHVTRPRTTPERERRLPDPYRLTPVEIATSFIAGTSRSTRRLDPDKRSDALGSLRVALRDALLKPPCLVAFSGGRDSSALLALAVDVARREGLDLPIPATNRFPGVPDVDEDEWQRLVLEHLALDDRVVLDLRDELDIIGPVAGPLLKEFGVIWPVNAHFISLLAKEARGGTLITGAGGDEVFSPGMTRLALVLCRAVRPNVHDLRAAALLLAPARVRAYRLRRTLKRLPWVRPEAHAEQSKQMAAWLAEEPLWWGTSVIDWWWRSKSRLAVVSSLDAVGAVHDVDVRHPFMDHRFLASVVVDRWRLGFPDRTAAMRSMFDGLLPDALMARETKAAFFQPFINSYSRAFVEVWDETGVDTELVDPVVLRRVWSERNVDARSYLLLQSAWLAAST